MDYELLSDDDYDSLPDDPELKFLALERKCRSNMARLIQEDEGNHNYGFYRIQYMTTVAAAAQELGIADLSYPDHLDTPMDGFDEFLRQASAVVTRLRLRPGAVKDPYSVQLGPRTKARIELQIRKLRDAINAADLSPDKRKRLQGQLDDFEKELSRQRFRFGPAMAALAALSIVVAEGTDFLANAPDAIATITQLIGADKAAEEAEAERLGLPSAQKKLPPPEKKRSDPRPAFEPGGMDDDIPF